MGAVRLPDTILKKLQREGRVPPELSRPVALAVVGAALRADRREDFAATLAIRAVQAGLPAPVREWRFHPRRRWRFDLAFVEQRVAVEVDGGAFSGGRHTSGPGFREDCVKLSEAAALGWRVLRVMPEHVESGEALRWLEAALAWGG